MEPGPIVAAVVVLVFAGASFFFALAETSFVNGLTITLHSRTFSFFRVLLDLTAKNDLLFQPF
jgi:hypothetical protein